ncbi:MAG: DUF3006 domain-containing protein [Anaerolineae bacterium]
MKGKPQASVPSAGKESNGKDFSLRGIVDRYEGDYAVLVFDDGQRLLWPREQLPAKAREGVAVAVALTVDLIDTEQRSARLQGLLADING